MMSVAAFDGDADSLLRLRLWRPRPDDLGDRGGNDVHVWELGAARDGDCERAVDAVLL